MLGTWIPPSLRWGLGRGLGVPAWVSAILHPKGELCARLLPGEWKLAGSDSKCQEPAKQSSHTEPLRKAFLVPLNR